MALRIAVLIFMAGFAASIGQILVIRELLVIFYGNELSTGLILACWLLCTAAGSGLTGRIFRNKPPKFGSLLAGFALFCAALPVTIVWIRAARALWSIPSGELLSPGMMLVIGFCATAPVCFFSGGLFAAAWELFALGCKRRGKIDFRLPGRIPGVRRRWAGILLHPPSALPFLCREPCPGCLSACRQPWWSAQGGNTRERFHARSFWRQSSLLHVFHLVTRTGWTFLTRRLQWGKSFLSIEGHPLPQPGISIQFRSILAIFKRTVAFFQPGPAERRTGCSSAAS